MAWPDEELQACCQDISWLCRRLSEANVRRREQNEYWVAHPYDPKRNQPVATGPTPEISIVGRPGQGANVDETKIAVPPLDAANASADEAVSLSGLSKQSFSTVAVSDIRDTRTTARPLTVYTPTEAGQRISASVPGLPKTAKDTSSFACPYCGTTLGVQEMKKRRSWKYVLGNLFLALRLYLSLLDSRLEFEDVSTESSLPFPAVSYIFHNACHTP